MSTLMRTEHLWKTYGTTGSKKVDALRDISLDIERGRIAAIAGPSGSGKSTLLSVLGLLARPSAGKVYIDGTDVSSVSEVFRTRIRRDNIGFVFQTQYLIPRLTAVENVTIPKLCMDVRVSDAEALARQRLELLGLEHRADFLVEELSGGERQRVSIARALVNSPRVLIADEPSASIDEAMTNDLLSILKGMNRDLQMTIIVASHDPHVIKWCDTVYSLTDGQLDRPT